MPYAQPNRYEDLYLKLRQHSIGTGNSDLARVSLLLRIADSAILLDNHRPAAIAVAHAGGPTVVLGELADGVGEHEDVVARDVVDLAPGAHDPGVVGGDDGDLVYAFGLELVDLLDVRGQVVGLAAGGEGACRREGSVSGDERVVCGSRLKREKRSAWGLAYPAR